MGPFLILSNTEIDIELGVWVKGWMNSSNEEWYNLQDKWEHLSQERNEEKMLKSRIC